MSAPAHHEPFILLTLVATAAVAYVLLFAHPSPSANPASVTELSFMQYHKYANTDHVPALAFRDQDNNLVQWTNNQWQYAKSGKALVPQPPPARANAVS